MQVLTQLSFCGPLARLLPDFLLSIHFSTHNSQLPLVWRNDDTEVLHCDEKRLNRIIHTLRMLAGAERSSGEMLQSLHRLRLGFEVPTAEASSWGRG